MGGEREGKGEVGEWVSGQQPVLPGGRNSGYKAQKGPEKKSLLEEFVAEN